MTSNIIYLLQSGSRFEQDDEGFLLRNGQRDWFNKDSRECFLRQSER